MAEERDVDIPPELFDEGARRWYCFAMRLYGETSRPVSGMTRGMNAAGLAEGRRRILNQALAIQEGRDPLNRLKDSRYNRRGLRFLIKTVRDGSY